MGYHITPLSELPLSNDFMFGEVMRQEKVCILFLEALLQKKIERIEYIDKQKDLSDSYMAHGIRLDVYLQDDAGAVHNIEMQNGSRHDLERRARYYQGGMDRHTLEKAKHYSDLPESFIVFVCSFDYYKRGLAIYERQSSIKGCADVVYDDGSRVMLLNTEYKDGNADPAILEFLDYVRTNDGKAEYRSELAKSARAAVEAVREDKDKEVSYMTFAMKMEDVRRDSRMEGRMEGREEGISAMVTTLHTLSFDQTAVAQKLMNLFGLTQVEAESKVKQYWD